LPGGPSALYCWGGASFLGDDGCGVSSFVEAKKACRQRSSTAGSARGGWDPAASNSWSSEADGVWRSQEKESSFEAGGGPPLQAERTTACRSQLLLPPLQHHPRSPSISRAGLSSSWLAEEGGREGEGRS